MAENEKDRRSPNQDDAIEQAFVEGTLPEADRRVPEIPPTATETDLQPVGHGTTVPASKETLLSLLDACESETGYSQKEAFTNLRKALS